MKMRSTLRNGAAVVAAAGLLAAGLTACAGDAAPGSVSNPTNDTEDVVEISFRWWGGEDRQARQMQALEVFHEQNPDIRVTPLPVSWDGYYQTLGVEMAARNAPDVFTLDGAWPLDLGARGGLLDLNTVDGLDLSAFGETTLAASTATTGELWGMPIGGNALAIAANLDIFEAAGVEVPDDETWTWEDLDRIAAEITAATPDGTYGLSILAGPMMRAFANQTDGGVFTLDGEINVSQDGITQWFELLRDTVASGAVAPPTLQSEMVGVAPAETLMGQGQAAMQTLWSNQMPTMTEASGGNLVLLRAPGDCTADTGGTWLNPGMFFAIPASSEHPEAAARLIDFMVNSPEAAEIMGTDRGVPFNAAMVDVVRPALSDDERHVVEYVERIAASSGPAIPEPTGAGAVNDITTRLSFEVMFDRMAPGDAAATWLAEVQASLDEAQ